MIADRVGAARARFERAGIASGEARLDARLLAQRALGWTEIDFLTRAREREPDAFANAFERLVERRERREPLAYILGERQFWNRSFAVSPAVLIPRPETELIVETALALPPAARAADVGTGSGCLAVTLACERAATRVIATDISEAALAVARSNADRHGVSTAIAFTHADLLDADDGLFDLIVSNPPYVSDSARGTLAPEVRDFEPEGALFAGADGLTVIRRLVAAAPAHLAPGGSLVIEIGAGQAAAVARLISSTPGLTMVGTRRDLQGIERVVIARRT